MVKCKSLCLFRDHFSQKKHSYRRHPGWVKCILIRRVDDLSAVGIEEKNKAPRFEKAFNHVPKEIWHVFDDPGECFQIVSDAVKKA